jgi:hypothetical protein
LFIGLGKIQSAIGLSGLVILSTGLAVALFCTVWAIEARVPYPVAIMAGYCTLVGSACLCATFLVVQNLSEEAPNQHKATTKLCSLGSRRYT